MASVEVQSASNCVRSTNKWVAMMMMMISLLTVNRAFVFKLNSVLNQILL